MCTWFYWLNLNYFHPSQRLVYMHICIVLIFIQQELWSNCFIHTSVQSIYKYNIVHNTSPIGLVIIGLQFMSWTLNATTFLCPYQPRNTTIKLLFILYSICENALSQTCVHGLFTEFELFSSLAVLSLIWTVLCPL